VYSWEIDNYLRFRNWKLEKHEYIYISDTKVNPQISRIKYEPFSNSFYMETDDGYNWIFRLKE
jgi:hypothetical protein